MHAYSVCFHLNGWYKESGIKLSEYKSKNGDEENFMYSRCAISTLKFNYENSFYYVAHNFNEIFVCDDRRLRNHRCSFLLFTLTLLMWWLWMILGSFTSITFFRFRFVCSQVLIKQQKSQILSSKKETIIKPNYFQFFKRPKTNNVNHSNFLLILCKQWKG